MGKPAWEGPQSKEQVAKMIAHLLKSLFICLACGRTIRGKDLRIGKGAPVRFTNDSIVPQFQCPRCQSWDFELMDSPD